MNEVVSPLDPKNPEETLNVTINKSDKGKGLVVQAPSSSKDKYMMEDTPRWLINEVMVRHNRKLYCTEEEGMRELVEAFKNESNCIVSLSLLSSVAFRVSSRFLGSNRPTTSFK